MPIPTIVFLPQPFANNAAPANINTIPNTGGVGPEATWNLGFPPITMQEEVSGGDPPLGQDFNGLLNALSTHIFAQQAGQLYRYASNVSTAIGGYPVGTMLESTDGVTVWFNTTAANTGDPDANAAGWVPMFNYGYTTLSGLTGGVVTLTRLQARRGVIILAGVLVSNLQVVVPNTLQNWLIVNTTTGAFDTTVKTAAGTGVSVPQGGYVAPTSVYGEGTNIYLSVAPLGVPIDQAATALSLAQRTNAGYLLATYFNQNSIPENPSIGSVIVENVAADGFFRKISIVNFEAQLILSGISGQVTDAQVPQSAVMQHSVALFTSAALTGVPTAPTAAVGTNTTQIASTAFVLANGVGASTQTYQDLTGSRAIATPYTNTTGRAIFVSVEIVGNSSVLGVATVDSIQVNSASIAGANFQVPLTFIVPPGSTYRIDVAGAFTAYSWIELR